MNDRTPKTRAHGEGSIYQRDDGIWVGSLTISIENGKQKRRNVYSKSRSAVAQKLALLKTKQQSGVLPAGRSPRLDAFLTGWIEAHQHKWATRTIEMREDEIRRHINPRLGQIRLNNLTATKVEWFQTDVANNVGLRTAAKTRGLLHQALKHAQRLGLIVANPAEVVPGIKAPTREIEPLTPYELRRFLALARYTRDCPLYYTAMTTGLRRGELLGLRWADVKDDRIIVRQVLKQVRSGFVLGPPKTKSGTRWVPVAPDTKAVLEQQRETLADLRSSRPGAWKDHNLVFPNTIGKPENPHNLKRRFNKLQDRARVRRFRLHDLRHTYASLMIQQGIDPKTLSAILGHSRTSFTMDVYVHQFEAHRAAYTIPLSDLLGSPKILDPETG